MTPLEGYLLELVQRISRHAPVDSLEGRELLENTLAPILRRALRGSQGPPAVVRWVNHQLNDFAPSEDSSRLARVLTRRLANWVVERIDEARLGEGRALETVAGG